MRLLLLCPWLPYPVTWGFAKRVYHVLEELATRHQVTLVTYSDGDDQAAQDVLGRLCTVHVVPRPALPAGKRLAQVASTLSPRSFQHRLMYSDAMQRQLDTLTSGDAFDVIHVSTSQMACFRFDPRSPLVLDEHNIEYELYYRVFQAEGSVPRRLFNWLEYRKFRREEIAAWRAADGIAMTSQREAVFVRQTLPGARVASVPNAVDTDHFAPAAADVDPDAIVMTGLMKYRPNVDGALYFAHEILPRIRAARPNATFYVVGGEPAPEVTALAGPHVVVTGSVDDVRPYVHRSAVFVVPLRMGSGTRLKVLEGLAMGKAMVSTAIGCEGIDVVDGEHLRIADTPETFADAVLALMGNPALARTLAGNGRTLMLDRYRWTTVVPTLEALYAEATASRSGRVRPA
jgi:sugar transferase (PEP-CTERM/EpsH1 system associated)